MFPGKCDRCGGPQWWTFDRRGDTWVTCKDSECVDEQLSLPDCDPVKPEFAHDGRGGTQESSQGKGTPEGGDARMIGAEVEWPGELPQAFLDSMWEGAHG